MKVTAVYTPIDRAPNARGMPREVELGGEPFLQPEGGWFRAGAVTLRIPVSFPGPER
jgi:hypothetical protein